MNTNAADWIHRLAEYPDIFPHQLDLIKDQVLLVKLSSEERRAASFLDQRVFTPNTQGSWYPWQTVSQHMKATTPKKVTHYIFHVGHCGSTLLSRLLGTSSEVESLREPLILRTLAQDIADNHEGRSFLTREEQKQRLNTLSLLWTRSAANTVVKATSICTDLMPDVLSLESAAKSIFIYNRLETHLETLLAGQNSLIDLKSFAQIRVQRLRQMTEIDIRLEELKLGQLAALSWLSETTRAALTMESFPEQITLLDFDDFLRQPIEVLENMMTFMSLPAAKATAVEAINSPVMQTYSKAPEFQYNADTRAGLLAEARAQHHDEIKAGIQWVNSLAEESPVIRKTLEVFNH
jgi:hypothetical protein